MQPYDDDTSIIDNKQLFKFVASMQTSMELLQEFVGLNEYSEDVDMDNRDRIKDMNATLRIVK